MVRLDTRTEPIIGSPTRTWYDNGLGRIVSRLDHVASFGRRQKLSTT
jgi:hypothetical protein